MYGYNGYQSYCCQNEGFGSWWGIIVVVVIIFFLFCNNNNRGCIN